jgi:osmotically-inducible protein OsmY
VGRLFQLAAAFAAGAAAMYLLDPVTGRRRRAMARDKAVAAGHDVQAFAHDTARHASDRLRGAVAQARADAPADDQRLLERIRSQLGHLVAQPGKVDVQVSGGRVTLRGSASTSEMDALVAAVSGMVGVERVDNQLHAGPVSHSTH